MLLKLSVTLALLFTVVLVARCWAFIGDWAEEKVFKNWTYRKKVVFGVFVTVLIEYLASWLISLQSGWLLIDTLFMMSILFFALGWMSGFSRTQFENRAKVWGKYTSGVNTGEVTVFTFTKSPMMTGTLLFGFINFIATIIIYYPYIL